MLAACSRIPTHLNGVCWKGKRCPWNSKQDIQWVLRRDWRISSRLACSLPFSSLPHISFQPSASLQNYLPCFPALSLQWIQGLPRSIFTSLFCPNTQQRWIICTDFGIRCGGDSNWPRLLDQPWSSSSWEQVLHNGWIHTCRSLHTFPAQSEDCCIELCAWLVTWICRYPNHVICQSESLANKFGARHSLGAIVAQNPGGSCFHMPRHFWKQHKHC
jgi:hypothetical protein